MQKSFTISTSKREELVDITDKVSEIIKDVKEGICHVFTAHATAAVVINENYDPNICLDFNDALLIYY